MEGYLKEDDFKSREQLLLDLQELRRDNSRLNRIIKRAHEAANNHNATTSTQHGMVRTSRRSRRQRVTAVRIPIVVACALCVLCAFFMSAFCVLQLAQLLQAFGASSAREPPVAVRIGVFLAAVPLAFPHLAHSSDPIFSASFSH